MERVCFVTVGATAKFPELLQAVLSPECLMVLKDEGFTVLNIQCGDSLADYPKFVKPAYFHMGIKIKAFGFNQEGLNKEMRECQARDGRKQGIIICHAGAGTVMDAMRLGLSMVAVPNPSLLDNHQEELAQELHQQNYATRSDIPGLAKAIRLACAKQAKPWAPQSLTLKQVVDDTAGYDEDDADKTYRTCHFEDVKVLTLWDVD